MHRAAAMPRVRSVPRLPRAAVWALALLALLVAGALWLRDSSLVSVQKVTVVGLTGPEAPRVTRQLEDAARDMTTLHVRGDQLRSVVEPYPVVKDLRVSTDFPHGLKITVVENTPVAAISVGDDRTPVSADGKLLRGADQRQLPIVPLRVAPGGNTIVDATARHAIAALAAAPTALRARVERASTTREGGLTLKLRNGPDLRFGGADRLAAKWAAATAVLASSASAGATYLDLRYPERPAAGGLEDPATQRDPEAVNSADPTQPTPTPGATAPVTP
ncbi:Cell division protein FtsQ [Baekduia alba]|uniref:cell division protein FtsQ/DivIB n=1 Tax=Baekduia alba TaxID=2997333 RepID=UPI0023408E0A|nr:cell division protein FtsQ/DivIB [Baekduia alba]WCB93651.1 Cell division protein FtsQ [Baekduia alba]